MSAATVIAIAAEDDRGLEGEVSGHFGRCPFYVLVEAEGDRVLGSRVVANSHFGEHQPGVMPRFIRDLGADVIIAGGMGPRAIDMFHRFGIDVATGAVGMVGNVLKAYLSGRHRGVVPCAHDHPESCGGDGERGGRGHGKNCH
jgi:predicted Fe-Mo cluster-binding NifX family protein